MNYQRQQEEKAALEAQAANNTRTLEVNKMILKLFTQPSCPKCPAAKAVVKQIEHKVKVEQYDIKTEDGLAEALEYNVMTTPSIVILDHEKNVLGEFLGQAPNVEELDKILG